RTCCGRWRWRTRSPSCPTGTASRRGPTSTCCCCRSLVAMTAPLVDPFARVVRDLRLSVTDRCNFRCGYCMPEEGMEWQPREDLLTYEELARIARVCVERFGFDGIRITGGEPTVRAHLPVLIEKLAALGADLSVTTNGASLRLLAHDLRAAGLRRVNISCDSLRRDRLLAITRRDAL